MCNSIIIAGGGTRLLGEALRGIVGRCRGTACACKSGAAMGGRSANGVRQDRLIKVVITVLLLDYYRFDLRL